MMVEIKKMDSEFKGHYCASLDCEEAELRVSREGNKIFNSPSSSVSLKITPQFASYSVSYSKMF